MGMERIKKYYLDNRLLCNCIILAILFFVNCFVQNFCFVVFLLIVVLMITEDRKDGFTILIFSLSFAGIEQENIEYIGFYLLAVCLVVYLVKNYIVLFAIEKQKINWKIFGAVMVFICYSVLHFGNYNVQFLIKFSAIMLLFLLLNLFVRHTDILNLKYNVSVLGVGLIISCAYFLTYFISPIVKCHIVWETGEYIRFTAFYTNPNVIAMVCEFCLAFLMYYLLQDKWEWTDIIAFIIFAVVGITTLSKAFLILFSIMMCVMVVYLLKKYKMTAFWWLFGTFCFIMIVLVINKDFLMTYMGRFIKGWQSDLDDGYQQILDVATTGRYELWTTMLDYIFTHPLVLIFGRGLGAPLIASVSSHNFYISLLYQMGIVGGVIFVGMFVVLIREYLKQNPHKVSKAVIVPIVIIGLLMCVEDLLLFMY